MSVPTGTFSNAFDNISAARSCVTCLNKYCTCTCMNAALHCKSSDDDDDDNFVESETCLR